jgi:Uma2 family endonuclease
MRKPTKLIRISEAEYLRAEEKATVRHEYVDGYVFAMSGSTRAHNLICMNISTFLHGHLRGGPCQATSNDLKLKIESARSYYYPDIMVDCERFVAKDVFVTEPVLLIEVLSPSTAAIDRREKLIAYQKIETLKEYLLVYQDRQQVELYRKEADGQWSYVVLNFTDELILESLPAGSLSMPFEVIYEGYSPPSRVKEEEVEYDFADF